MTDHNAPPPPGYPQDPRQDPQQDHTGHAMDTDRLLSCCNDTHALLWDYVCGTLDNHLALLTEVFLELSSDARTIMRQMDMIAGTMFEHNCPPEKMRDDSLDRVLDAITCPHATATRHQNDDSAATTSNNNSPSYRDTDLLPAAMQRYLPRTGRKLKWRRIARGAQICTLDIASGDLMSGTDNSHRHNHILLMVKLAPGASVPQHTHQTDEITLVIDGVFTDNGSTYGKGDIIIAHENTAHSPSASGNMPCICLMASDTPIHFPRSPAARLLDLLGL